MRLQTPAAFFNALRSGLLGPHLSADEVDGLNALLAACREFPLSWTAYALATAYHETAGTMRPVREIGSDAYFRRMYDLTGDRPHVAERLGNIRPGDGVLYCGRGYVQLTGRRNYALAQDKLGVRLLDEPRLAERADIAAQILREGMTEGWFTGKRFADFLPAAGAASRAQFKAARRIINGVDRDVLIAGHAVQFQDALSAGGWAS